ncbi:hypothetical protein OAT42_05560 [Alphaproteobacteria bacterium]|nr:hypothetical protein [Alphaproteobacteria bacterium]
MRYYGDWLLYFGLSFPLLIPLILIYRGYFFLRYGHNPDLSIDNFFYQTSSFSWKGVEIIYDYIASFQIEVLIIIIWLVMVIFTPFGFSLYNSIFKK